MPAHYDESAGFAVEPVRKIDVIAIVILDARDQRALDVDTARVHRQVSRLRHHQDVVILVDNFVAKIDRRLVVVKAVRNYITFVHRIMRSDRYTVDLNTSIIHAVRPTLCGMIWKAV
jgi:hypothetical protein